MAKEQEGMKDELVETIMDLCDLYLKLGEVCKSSSIIRVNKRDLSINTICDAIFFREEIWKKLLEVLQKIHRL